jgi:hypothetical protein
LSDLLRPGWEDPLTKLVIAQLLNDRGVDSLDDAGIADPTLDRQSNFALTDKGLAFHWNPYQLACYAVGDIDAFLPYSAVSSLIPPDGLLAFALHGLDGAH